MSKAVLAVLIASSFAFALSIRPVKGGAAIYIRANGSIDPPTAPIVREGDIYTLTGNIYVGDDGIAIERDNMTLDGAGYTLQGSEELITYGIYIRNRHNITIQDMVITGFTNGIFLWNASDSYIFGNTVRNHYGGIQLSNSMNNVVVDNNVSHSQSSGIYLSNSNSNIISNNDCSGASPVGGIGVLLSYSNNNVISQNNASNGFIGILLDNPSYNNTVTDNISNNNIDGGIGVASAQNVTISRNTVNNNKIGISAGDVHNSVIIGNTISNSAEVGILLLDSTFNLVTENTVKSSDYWGMVLKNVRGTSDHNTFWENDIKSNKYGIRVEIGDYNKFYHNNFINNTISVQAVFSINIWDDGYPSGGNYWSDYSGTDLFSGLFQNDTGSDGIGDSPYIINEPNRDNYPLMQPWRPTDWWPMFHYDARHSGYSPEDAPDTNKTLWTFQTGNRVASSPAVVDGRLFIGSWDSYLYCLNATTGSLLWRQSTGSWVDSSPAVAYGIVYVGSWNGVLYAFNATTGSVIWTHQTGDRIQVGSPTVYDRIVYIESFDGNLYALNATTGQVIWTHPFGTRLFSSPAVSYGLVYVRARFNLTALNAKDGALNWTRQISTTWSLDVGSPTVADEMVFVFGDKDFWALDATSGTVIWTHFIGGQVHSTPAFSDGIVFAPIAADVSAFNATTGTSIWDFSDFIQRPDSSPAIADGKVFFGGRNGKVYAINLLDGALLWTYQTEDMIWYSSPAIVRGNLFIGSNDGKVYAFGLKHDVAIANVTTSKNVVGQGHSVNITVTIENRGDFTEMFNVTVNYNETAITLPDGSDYQTNTLASGSSVSVTFIWNTTGASKGNYTMSAVDDTVPGEMDTADNTFIDGWVMVAMVGDITGDDGWPDGKVDILDIATVAILFGVNYPDPRYNPNYDIDNNLMIDILDVAAVAIHFGETDQ